MDICVKNSKFAQIVGDSLRNALVDEKSGELIARLALMGGYEVVIRNLSIFNLNKDEKLIKNHRNINIKREFYDKNSGLRHDLYIEDKNGCKSIFEFKHSYLRQIVNKDGVKKSIEGNIRGILNHVVDNVPKGCNGNFVYIISNVIDSSISGDLRADYCKVDPEINEEKGVDDLMNYFDMKFNESGINIRYKENKIVKCEDGAVSVTIIIYGVE